MTASLDRDLDRLSRLAFRRTEIDDPPERLLQLAARAEFKGHPPELVVEWLAGRGVDV